MAPSGWQQASIDAEVLQSEVRATRMRLGFGVLGCVGVGVLWPTNTPATSVSTLAVGVAYTVWSFYALRRAQACRPVAGWLHAILDQCVVAGTSAVSMLNHSGGYEALLAPIFPLLHVLWIGLAALRHAVGPPLVAGAAAAVSRAAVLVWVVGSGAVNVTETATYGSPAIGLADQWTIVVCLAVAGFAAAWVAHSSRNLLVRAARDGVAREQLARAQASTKVDLTLLQANEASYRAAFESVPAGLALLTPPPALRVFRVNRALAGMLGWRAEDLVGVPLGDLLVGDVLPDATVGRDLMLRRRDGTHVTTRASMTLTLESGEVRHLLAQFVAVAEGSAAVPVRASSGRDRDPSGPLAGARVLVAEDDEDLLEWVGAVLRGVGAEVLLVRSVAGARAFLGGPAPARIDAAVIDIRLPERLPERLPGNDDGMVREPGGIGLAEALEQAHPGIVVLFVSGAAPGKPVSHPVLVKPFTRDALLAHLDARVCRAGPVGA